MMEVAVAVADLCYEKGSETHWQIVKKCLAVLEMEGSKSPCFVCGSKRTLIIEKHPGETIVQVDQIKLGLTMIQAPIWTTGDGAEKLKSIIQLAENQAAGRGAKIAVDLLQDRPLWTRFRLAWGLIRRKLS